MVLLQFISLSLVLKFFKFVLVGSSGILVDFSITYLFKEKLKAPKFFSSSMGFGVAACSNYLLNSAWTFDVATDSFIQFQHFCLFALIGLAASNIFIFLFIKKFNWNLYLAKICTIVIISLWNFLSNYLYTFS